MSEKAKQFFRKPNGSVFPAILALGGLAGGTYYLFEQREKAKKRVVSQPEVIPESKLKNPSESKPSVDVSEKSTRK